MAASSLRHAGRMAVGALSFLALGGACAQGTTAGEPNSNPLTDGASAGMDGSVAGSVGATAGDTSTSSAGVAPLGGTGGGSAGSESAGTNAEAGGTGGAAGTGGTAGGGGLAGASAGSGGGGGDGGTGGAAGASGSAGMAGGGSGPVGYRYVKLLALSEQSGAVWTSVAELQVFTTGNVPIDRANWLASADSQEIDDENDPSSAAIDGNTATFWHTEWEPAPNNVNDPPLPHWLVIDMMTPHLVTGFSYLPRQVGKNGRIKAWEFYVSNDGQTWGTAVNKGTFIDGTALQSVTF